MTTFRFSLRPQLFRWSALALLLFAGSAQAVERAGTPPVLHVHVTTPPSWSILYEDRVADLFVDQMRDVFQRRGIGWPVEHLSFVEDPAKTPWLLSVEIVEWRMNPIGNIDCTVRASLNTPRGERSLGVFHHTVPRWLGGYGRWGLSRSFEESAEGAIEEMARAILRSELLPGAGDVAA
jgi:hypothetical protein